MGIMKGLQGPIMQEVRKVVDAHLKKAYQAIEKASHAEYHKGFMELALDIQGMESQILTGKGESEGVLPGNRRGRADYPVSDLQASFFFSRSETIWGGTSQIQRNIVSERALGLPKEPTAAK